MAVAARTFERGIHGLRECFALPIFYRTAPRATAS